MFKEKHAQLVDCGEFGEVLGVCSCRLEDEEGLFLEAVGVQLAAELKWSGRRANVTGYEAVVLKQSPDSVKTYVPERKRKIITKACGKRILAP